MESATVYNPIPDLAREPPTARLILKMSNRTVSCKVSAVIEELKANRERLSDEDLNRILVMAELMWQERKRRLGC